MASEESSSESEVEWEDVEPLPDPMDVLTSEPRASQQRTEDKPAAAGSLEIFLQKDGLLGKGKRKSKQNFLEKAIANFNRELRHSSHKAHLLCLLAHGLKLSGQCDNPVLQSILLSLLPREFVYHNIEHYNQDSFVKLLKWFSKETTHSKLCQSVEASCPEASEMNQVQLLVTLLRAVGLRSRLVLVLDPLPFKLSGKSATGKGKSPAKGTVDEDVNIAESQKEESNSEVNTATESEKTSSSVTKFSSLSLPSKGGGIERPETEKDYGGSSSKPATRGRKRKASSLQGTSKKKRNTYRKPSSSTTACESSPYFKKRATVTKGKGKTAEKCESESDNGQSNSSDSDYVAELETKRSKGKVGGRRKQYHPDDREDSDFETNPPRKRRQSKEGDTPLAKKIKLAAKKNVSSSHHQPVEDDADVIMEDIEGHSRKRSLEGNTLEGDFHGSKFYDVTTSWVEVYLSSKRRWSSLHLSSCSVDQPQLCEKHCYRKLSYTVGIESAPHGQVRDVTARYASAWCTRTRKQRLSEEWWTETLKPFSPPKLECEEEDADILTILYSYPLPNSINDYKNHPLYALRRHLLKFETIYPEETQSLGYCRGEPVYSRECVRTLHTRETWLKEGRVVKKGERPHKTVKARPKKGQSVLEAQNSTVEVFGRWQTEEYVPPPVVNGKVPRNEYGNVEVFQPSMLPAGACHIRISGIQRVARKLEIDFAPAMMGWDFHGGYCHPILDGIVVAKEFEAVLLEAWEQEEQLLIEKDIKKREQRVLERWRKLTKGLLIRERVKRRYMF